MNTIKSSFAAALLFLSVLSSTNAVATPPPPPSNDIFANATTITHNVGCSANAAYTTTGATADGTKPSKWANGPTNNVWFKFQATTTAMSADVKVYNGEGTMRNPRLALYSASQTEIWSTEENGTYVDIGFSYEGLVVGTWYYLQVDNLNIAGYNGTFTLCLRTTTGPDVPSGATVLTHNAGCSALQAYTTSIGTPDGTRPAGWQIGPNANVWFKFQALTTAVSVLVKTGDTEGLARRMEVALYDASMTLLRSGAQNGTYDDVGVSYNALTVGNWYYINVDNGDLAYERGTFTICIDSQTSADYAAGATVVPHSAAWCSANAAYTTMIGTPDGTKPTNWAIGPTSNVWFKFQATAATVSVDLKVDAGEGTLRRPKLALYNSGFIEILSINEDGNFTDIGLSYASLTIGQWYYLNVDNGDLFYERGTFTLCVSTDVTNDYPAGAITVPHQADWCSADAAYTTLSGTADGTKPSNWFDGPYNNVWFKFVATATGVSVGVFSGDTEGTLKRPRIALYSSSFTELRSNGDIGTTYIDNGVSYDALTVGQTYYIAVDNGNSANQYDRGTFKLCVSSTLNNDYPAGAIELTSLNNWCSPQAGYTTFIGTPDGTRPTSWTYGPTANVWFKFKAQRPNVTINVKTGAPEGTLKRPNVSLHNSSLTHLTSVHDAGNSVDIAINNYTGLTIGQYYYINIDDGNLNSDRGTFMVCIDNALAGTTGFTAVGNVGQNELDWMYTNGNQSNFEVQRSTTPGTGYTTLATVGSTIREYNDATAVAGTKYYYKVRATNAGGGSAFSAEIPVVTFVAGQQSIIWTNAGGATINGNILTKTAVAGWGNSGAESKNRLADHTDGWIRYTVPSITAGEFAFGFSDVNPDNQQYSIGYAIHLSNTAQTYVRTLGTSQASFNAAPGDVLEIGREGSSIKFKQNGTVVYTVTTAPLNSMIVDAAINTATSSIMGLSTSFGGPGSYRITWSSLVGVSQPDSITVTKTATSGYGNAGAVSGSTLGSGKDGWVEFKLDALTAEKTFGFSDVNSDNDVNSIDYAFNISSNLVFAFENGVSRGAITGAAVNDVLRIWRIGSNIYWLKNGVIVSTKTSGAITGSLKADVAINTTGASVIHGRSSFFADEGLVPDNVEFLALKALWDNLGGSGWYNKSNWPVGTWPSSASAAQFGTWYGITVVNNDVVGVDMQYNNCSGTIPAALGNLTELTYLSFYSTGLITGSIPSEIGNLTKLTDLYLSYNQLSGSIPTTITNLTHLDALWLDHNYNISGTIPTGIFDLTSIESVHLESNSLTGSIPTNLGNATNLTTLVLHNNQLTGSLPSSIGNLSNLNYLDVQVNSLSGTLPASLGNLHNLNIVYMNNNSFSGSLPPEMSTCYGLTNLSMYMNQFTGSLPSSWSSLVNLSGLSLAYNQLTGSIPTSWAGMLHLSSLDVGNNQLSGTLPPELATSFPVLHSLALNNNQFSGAVPAAFGTGATLRTLNFANNNFTGIPTIYTNKSLLVITLEGNKLDFADLEPLFSIPEGGTTPVHGFAYLSYIDQQPLDAPTSVLAVVGGKLKIRDIPIALGPHSSQHWEFQVGASWNNVDNLDTDATHLTFGINVLLIGEVGNYRYTQSSTMVPGLTLKSKAIPVTVVTGQGLVPDLYEFQALKNIYDQMGGESWYNNYGWPTPGNWPTSATSDDFATWSGLIVINNDVQQFNLQFNNLTNTISASFADLDELTDLYLTYNSISGAVPPQLGQLLKLQTLAIEYNTITSLPAELANAVSLNNLYTSQNPLTGSLPLWLWDMPAIKNVSFSGCQFSGPIPSSIGNATHLVSLALNENQLTGPIPATIANLTNLMSLFLDNNPLNTTIPAAIGGLTNVTYLSLGGCGLTGTIPAEIGNLTHLQDLELGGNQLTGPLPSQMANLPGITWINLYNNQIGGTLPTFLNSLTTLTFLSLGNNQFTGSIPEEIYEMNNLQNLELSNNQLTGSISPSIQKMTNIQYFSAAGNQLTGSIPSSIGYLENLTSLYLSNNNLSGPLPDAMGNLNILAYINLDHNHLSGEIPASFGHLNYLVDLQLSYNELSGAIPDALTALPQLGYLHLSNNDFTSVPKTWANQGNIFIDVSTNRIDYGHLEQLFSSPQHFVIGGGLTSYGQKIFEAPDLIEVPKNGVLTITAEDPGVHANLAWYYISSPGAQSVQINSINEDATQRTLKLSNFQPSSEGEYYYWEQNTWVTYESSQRYSEHITVKTVDQLNVTFNPDKLYNGSISAMRWRTDAPYAAGNTDLTGIYLFKYDSKYQLQETQFATPGVGNTYVLAANKMRVNNITYDPNGNIGSMNRFDKDGNRIHEFVYTYNSAGAGVQQKNQLQSIAGRATYSYNQIGELVGEDNTEESDQYVDYDLLGRVVAVYDNSGKSFASLTVTYSYDERGFRVVKVNHKTGRITWYLRDTSGNVTSVFESSVEDNTTNKTEVTVYGGAKLGTFYPGTGETDGIMAYELTDHQGNVRAIVEDRTIEYTATMEDNSVADITNPRVSEDYYFRNIWETEQVDVDMNHTPAMPGVVDNPNSSAYLFWNDNLGTTYVQKGIGPAMTLKVGAGDVLNIDTWARYEENTSYARDFTQTVFASLLGGTFVETNGIDNLSTITSLFQNGIGATGVFERGSDDSKPFAYLNYMLFNDSFELQKAGSLRVDEDGEFASGEELLHNFDHLQFDPVTVDESGYIYVWVSNESKETKVWFDDLKVVHRGSMTTQATDYDPWGYVQRDEKTDQQMIYRYGAQGQYSEKDDETGWNHFEMREYDAVTARWTRPDSYGQFSSPYLALGNDPARSVDPDGGYIFVAGGSPEQILAALQVLNSSKIGRRLIAKFINDPHNDIYIKFGETRNVKEDGTEFAGAITFRSESMGQQRALMVENEIFDIKNHPTLMKSGLQYFVNFNGTDLDGNDQSFAFITVRTKSSRSARQRAEDLGHEIWAHVVLKDDGTHRLFNGSGSNKNLHDAIEAVKDIQNNLHLANFRKDTYQLMYGAPEARPKGKPPVRTPRYRH